MIRAEFVRCSVCDVLPWLPPLCIECRERQALFEQQARVGRWIIDHLDTIRVGGDVVCKTCHKLYYDHLEILPTFHLLCDGRLGKT